MLQESLIPQFHQLWSCSSLGLHFAIVKHLLRKVNGDLWYWNFCFHYITFYPTTLITMVWCRMILMFDWSNGEICDSFEIWIWMHFVRVTRPELIGPPSTQCQSNNITLQLHLHNQCQAIKHHTFPLSNINQTTLHCIYICIMIDHWRLKYTEVQSQSPPLSNNLNIL